MNFSTKIVLLSAGLSLFLSIYLFFFMQSEDAKLYGIFVGLWVPSILSAYRVIESSVSASEIDQEDEPEINEDYIYEYRDGSNFKLKGSPRNTAGWNSVEATGHIVEKIGPILATKYSEVN